MVSFPLGILMGIVWEAYHKGVPLLGVPEITLENVAKDTSPMDHTKGYPLDP